MHAKNSSLRCLVIGGGGFIGSHLVSKLLERGREVTVLDYSDMSTRSGIPGATYITGDFGDADVLRPLVEEHDEVVHLAYATVPNTSFDEPLADLDQNLHPAVQLFDIVASRGARLLLVSSGGTVYGEAATNPIAEDHPTRPISPYGVTKLTLEKYAYLYAVTRGLQVICVRPANPFGIGQRPFAGQGFISTAMATALQGKQVTIYGQQGTVRDYIYIDDLITGMLMVLEYGDSNETYNIGSSTGRSNLDVLHAMAPLLRAVGTEIMINYEPERPFDVKVNVLDSNKLHQLGWQLEYTFEHGLQKTLAWLRQ